jgi:hypothetical protein
MEKYKENVSTGIMYRYLEAYFSSVCERREGRHFYGEGWHVMLVDEDGEAAGNIYMPSTLIVIEGERNACEELMKQYEMSILRVDGWN